MGHRLLLGKFVAEADATSHPETHVIAAMQRARFHQADAHLAVIVAMVRHSPKAGSSWCRTWRVRHGLDLHAALDLGRVGEHHAQARRRDDRLAVPRDHIDRAAVIVGRDLHRDLAVGRGFDRVGLSCGLGEFERLVDRRIGGAVLGEAALAIRPSRWRWSSSCSHLPDRRPERARRSSVALLIWTSVRPPRGRAGGRVRACRPD